MEFTGEYFAWVEQHIADDPFKLRLKYLSNPNHPEWLPLAIDQIETRSKARKKLMADGHSLLPAIVAPRYALEQCSSLPAAQLHAEIISRHFGDNTLSAVDLTCGLGIDALALAKKGINVTAVERNQVQAEIAQYNFRDYRNVKVVNDDCESFLSRSGINFDAAFIDPGRRDSSGKRFYSIADCSPNLLELIPLLQRRTGYVLAKLSPMLDITKTLTELGHVLRMHVVGLDDECKELLVEMDFRTPATQPIEEIPIVVNDLNVSRPFTFTLGEEKTAHVDAVYGIGSVGGYLYLPSASLMKAGCFRTIAKHFSLMELAPSSHLFFSQKINTDFPGKIYLIDEIIPFDKSNQRSLAKRQLKADVTARNFPLSPVEVTRRLNLSPGSDNHIFATTSTNGKILILTHKVNV